MNDLSRKILGQNLKVMLGYIILCIVLSAIMKGGTLGYALGMAVFVGLHSISNFFISLGHFLSGNKQLGQSYLLSSFLVSLIGFSACAGGFGVLSVISK